MEIDDELKSNIASTDTWLRLALIVVFGFITSVVAMPVVWVLAGVQFLFSLFTGKPNENLHRIHQNLAAWLNQVFSYMLYVSDRKPFPLSDLPDGDSEGDQAKASSAAKPAKAKSGSRKKDAEEEIG